jgi:hypothetical protein
VGGCACGRYRRGGGADRCEGGVTFYSDSVAGVVLVHAQVDVETMYAGLGFETDQSLGRWDEEGIEHVGMFRWMVLDK